MAPQDTLWGLDIEAVAEAEKKRRVTLPYVFLAECRYFI